MPTNSEVQARLVREIYDAAESSGLSVDTRAQDYLGTLVSEAVDRMETENRLEADEDIEEAAAAFRQLVTASVVETRREARTSSGKPEYRGAGQAAQAAPMVREASILRALKGLCPIWPICPPP
jgi:hypothetical protein